MACSTKTISNTDIDKFISQYDSVNFNSIRGLFIAQRSATLNEVVYIVDKYDENKPPYFVKFNLYDQAVAEIDRTQLEVHRIKDYLTEKEITNAVNVLRHHDLFLLAMDSAENVYINPFYANNPAYLLRLKDATGDSIITKGYKFTLYKENWYLGKS